MIRLPAVTLPEAAQNTLSGLQQDVNSQPSYAQQVTRGKVLFDQKSRSQAFRPVRDALGKLCSGARRCCYCEDSQATDIEHIWPKDFYPGLVFSWENYLYGCTRCNRPKSNRCEIYSHDTRLNVPAFVKQHKSHPPEGDPLLINPRLEDPFEFMMLELQDTFFFLPIKAPGTQSRERAEHTIQLLKLNEEDVLPVARAEAYENYVARLEKYIYQKLGNRPPEALARLVHSITKMGHPTVWHEMKRQAQTDFHKVAPRNIQHLKDLFSAVPEALQW